jgi:hypothetical protein
MLAARGALLLLSSPAPETPFPERHTSQPMGRPWGQDSIELGPEGGHRHACTIGPTLPCVSVPSGRYLVRLSLVRRLMGVNRHGKLQRACPCFRDSASRRGISVRSGNRSRLPLASTAPGSPRRAAGGHRYFGDLGRNGGQLGLDSAPLSGRLGTLPGERLQNRRTYRSDVLRQRQCRGRVW